MRDIESLLEEKLRYRARDNRLRELHAQKGLIDFCSNDYLGFSRSNFLKKKTDWLVKKYASRNGSTGSRLISGNTHLVEQLERAIADYHLAEAGLLFTSGYTANLGLISCLARSTDTIFFDELVHASIHDGLKLSKAKSVGFIHNDLEDLKNKMAKASGNFFVVVESVYSMDGDEAPLPELAKLCRAMGAALIVDEAHSTGVFGEQGRGLVVEQGLQDCVFARMHSFGKAMGGHGAIVLGSRLLRNYLINYARSFIYTTALPPHCLHHIEAAYELLAHTAKIHQLHKRINYFKECIHPDFATRFVESRSAIQSLIVPESAKVKAFATELQSLGFFVYPVVAPTVPAGKERLRFSIHAFNTTEEIERLANSINTLL